LAEEDERKKQEEEDKKNKPKAKNRYLPVRGDKVDEKIAEFMNDFELDIPLERISEGQYMFGQRKIFAKIMNEKLVIRVGGGFMLMSEFLDNYG
jgi:hypothetical protein